MVRNRAACKIAFCPVCSAARSVRRYKLITSALALILAEHPGMRYVLGLQEASVVGMADGYAQATRNAGFVNLHSGAGVGNALGNIYTAHRNQTPLVITAGQQARSILPLQA